MTATDDIGSSGGFRGFENQWTRPIRNRLQVRIFSFKLQFLNLAVRQILGLEILGLRVLGLQICHSTTITGCLLSFVTRSPTHIHRRLSGISLSLSLSGLISSIHLVTTYLAFY